MPNFRHIKSTFLGINDEPLRGAPIEVTYLTGNYVDNIEFSDETKTYYTDNEGVVRFKVWCNEEGETASRYKFTLPSGESFQAIIPVGTAELELTALRTGGSSSNNPQAQSLITYILNEVGSGGGTIPLASSTVSGRVRTNSTSGDPVVYLKSEVDSDLSSKANTSTTYTKTEVDNLISSSGGGGSGEVTTASNVGVGGVSVYKQKVNSTLQFKSINAGSNKVSVTNDTANNEIDIDINESNISLNNLSGALSLTKGGTGATTASVALTNLGAASSSQLTSHTSNTSNPHGVTSEQIGAIPSSQKGAANGVASLDNNSTIPNNQIPTSIARLTDVTSSQVGKDTAQWNSDRIKGVPIDDTNKANGRILKFNGTSLVYSDDLLGVSGSGEANTASNIGTEGIGIFDEKIGVDLTFKKLNPGSDKVTITDDAPHSKIDININESNITLSNLGGVLPIAKGGTGATAANQAVVNLGVIPNSEKGNPNGVATLTLDGTIPDSQIPASIARDSEVSTKANATDLTNHISDTDNPHEVTVAQIGAISISEKGAANGVATLDANSLIPTAQISTSIARVTDISTTNLTGTLPINKGGTGATTVSQALTNLGAISTSEKGEINGVATLDTNAKIPDNQLASTIVRNSELTTGLATKANAADLTNHTTNSSNPHSVTAAQVGAIPTSEKGAASGVATLDSNTLIPTTQIPSSIARVVDITATNLTGTVPITKGGTGATTATNARANLGVPSTTDLTNHTTNTSNPHGVNASQVGNTVAQWNANQIKGVTIDDTGKANGRVLKFNSTTNSLEYADDLLGEAGSGEANTVTNIGISGVGLYKQKVGVNFEFKKLNAGSTKVSITDDTTNNKVDIDINEANLTISNLSGILPISKGGTGANNAEDALANLGVASSTTLDNHIANVSNPHSVTAAQVGAISFIEKGNAEGVATLDNLGKIPDYQIPDNIVRDNKLVVFIREAAKVIDLNSHIANFNNPHEVTADQVGAISLEEKGTPNGVATLDSNSYIVDTQIPKFIIREDDLIRRLTIKADITDLNNHIANVNNPHNITPNQIGAISVLEKGNPNGVATLNDYGIVLDNQLPYSVARLDKPQEYIATQRSFITTDSISGSYTIKLITNMHSYTLIGNINKLSAEGMQAGATYTIYLKEDSIGGRTCTFDSKVFKAKDGDILEINTLPNKRNRLTCTCETGVNLDCVLESWD